MGGAVSLASSSFLGSSTRKNSSSSSSSSGSGSNTRKNSSSSSSGSSTRKKYHVFISFRGADTRLTFTCHLHRALGLEKIRAYIDEESLEKGDEITPSLKEAIADSEISLVILSKDYASSRWCLDELDEILRCKERNNQIVVPVFYYVDPSDVRKQQHSYASAFDAHKIRFKDQKDKVQQWRNSLKAVADLAGFNSSDFGSDSKLVETVVEDIKKKLGCILMLPSNDSKDLVGIEKRIQDVKSKLNMGSYGVCILGIWGMGGIGKTTLAEAVFKQLAPQFDNYCFLDNVREEFETGRLHKLQKKFFSEILLSKEKSLYKISPFVKDRLRHEKVLLVLDDIDNIKQWENSVGEIHGWFGSGSKIIVTSRDKKVLEKIKTNEIYEVEGLSFDESLHLFCLKAFQQSSPTRDYEGLSQRAVSYAGGLPLALIVLGSHLGSNDTNDVWNSELDKLEKYPNKDIHKVLEISYNGLDPNGKQVFLDIAFFFNGKERNFVIQRLDGLGRFGETGIRNLTDRSIITVENDIIWMHNLLQQMGKRIVEEESESNPGKRSRLSSTTDILRVLENNMGTEAIQGISLETYQLKDVLQLKSRVFKKMYNLKYLKLSIDEGENCLNFPKGLKYLPNELRYLYWNKYPMKSLPSKFKPCNLIELDLSNNKLERLWDGVQDLANLKLLNLDSSYNLIQIPDLSLALKLEKINLGTCTRLENLPSSFSKLESLQDLDLSYCYNFNKFPELPVNIEHLNMMYTSIEEVPSSIGRLSHLRSMRLYMCSKLEYLPEIPKHLTLLYIHCTGIRNLSSSIVNVIGRHSLCLNGCKNLQFIPNNIYNLQLKNIYLDGCSKLESLPHPLSTNSLFWKTLKLDGTNVSEIPDWLFRLPVLHELSLYETGIRTIPANIKHSKLRELNIRDCKSLEYLPELPVSIKRVDARGCTSLQKILNASIDTRSFSISKTLTAFEEEPWSYDGYYTEELRFDDCLELDHNNIIFEFQIRALRLNFLPRPKEVKFPRMKHLDWDSVCIDERCVSISFSGDEIPKWFNYQNDHGSSINMKLLPPQCYDKANFMGFASCLVVAPELKHGVHLSGCDVLHSFTLRCDVNVQTNNGQKCCTFTKTTLAFKKDPSNHVLMCYFHTNEIDLVSAKEISFVFHTFPGSYSPFRTVPEPYSPFTFKVKRCGIRMLQVQDAVDFGIRITEYVHWKDNIISNEDIITDETIIIDEDEPSELQSVNLETNEPPPKRTKFSSSP